MPLARLERLAVAERERVRRHDQVTCARGARERFPVEPLTTVVNVHPQAGREPLGLALPVPGHRHRADQQRRAHGLATAGPASPVPDRAVRGLLALAEQQRKHLHGLPKPHVISQTRSKPEARQEREPREPALLVGPQLADERTGRLHPLEPALAVGAQHLPEPTLGVDLDLGRRRSAGARSRAADPKPFAQQFARRCAAAHAPALEEAQCHLDVLGAQRDPASPRLDQRQLQLRQRLELGH